MRWTQGMDRMGQIMWSQRGRGMHFFTYTCHRWGRLTPTLGKGGRAMTYTRKRKLSTLTVHKHRLVQNRKEKKLDTSERLEQNLWVRTHFHSESRTIMSETLTGVWEKQILKKGHFCYQPNETRSNRRQDKKQEGNKQKQSPKPAQSQDLQN